MALPTPRAVAVAIAMAVARVAVAADSPCPTPAAIAAELQRLPGSGGGAALARSEVAVDGRTMRIVLRDSDGRMLGVREVEAPRDCRQRAAVAAVVLAAWSHTWENTELPSVPAAAPRRLAELGLQGAAHHDGRRVSPGVALLAGLQLSGPLGAGVIADFTTERALALGPGAVAYSFARVGAGPVYRWERGTAWIDGTLFVQIVRLAVTPRDLPGAGATALWAAGAQARVRGGLWWGPLMPFLAASVGRRFVRDRLTLDDDPGTAELSPWDVELGAGVALRFGR
jgi:hypothetical protein